MKKNYIRTITSAAMICILVAGGFSISSCGSNSSKGAKEAPKKVMVTVKAAQVKEVDQIELFAGTVEGYNTNNISPQTSSRIEKIYVEVGDHVAKGQKLAQMDQSNLTQSRLQMENNKLEFERTKQLFEVGGASQSEYDSRKLAYEISQTAYNNLLTNTYLVSPITGVVTARNYDAGDMYAMGQPLFTVEQIRPVKIMVNAPESLFGKIRKGQSVDIDLVIFPGEVFPGKINIVYPTINTQTRTFAVEIIIQNANERLRPGMFARATFKYGTAKNVVVPDVAVVKQSGSGDRYVYTVENGKVVFHKVKLGRVIGTEQEILSGVPEGSMVIIEGQYVVTNGQEVDFKEGEPAGFVPDELE